MRFGSVTRFGELFDWPQLSAWLVKAWPKGPQVGGAWLEGLEVNCLIMFQINCPLIAEAF